MWAAVGIQAELQPLDQNRLVQNMSSKQFVASLYRFTGRSDHISIPTRFSIRIRRRRAFLELYALQKQPDRCVARAGMTETGLEARRAIYAKISAILAQDLPYVFLFHPADGVVVGKKVQGFTAMPDGLVRLSEIWLREMFFDPQMGVQRPQRRRNASGCFVGRVPADCAFARRSCGIDFGRFATPERVAALRAQLGLDQPLYVQYFHWLGNVLSGNFGRSVHSG